jgi:hypothetical protein
VLDYLPTILGFCAAGFDSLVVHSAGSKSVATRFYRRFIVEDVADAYDRSDALDRLRSFEGRLGFRASNCVGAALVSIVLALKIRDIQWR